LQQSKRRLARAIEYLEEYGHYELGEDDGDDGDETEIENESVMPFSAFCFSFCAHF